MHPRELSMTIGGSTLWAVPSIHYRAPFAEQVNWLVRNRHPQAIAVELGPQAATAAADWLTELSRERNFPCMLGLVRPNRRLHPQVREVAQRLQQITQTDLSDLPPELLKQTLGYSSLSVLYLSPTDSIIEAVRCAVEAKDIHLYGVDLEETASPRRRDILLQDPTSMQNFSLPEYVERNDAYAEMQRDDIVDARREFAMAARLKTLLQKYQRVLYVCGLAHWTKMCELLHAAEPQPAPVIEARSQTSMLYHRVVVHPIMAIHHLDTFPAFATDYEHARVHMGALNEPQQKLNLAVIFQNLVRNAYEGHFGLADESDQLKRSLGDWEARGDFEQLLRNLCTLRHRSIPDLITAMQVAQGVMSESFCRVFAEKLMKFNWASPNQDLFRGLPVLAPAPSAADRPQRAEFVDRDGHRSPAFFVSDLPDGDSIPVSVPIPWEWEDEQREPPPPTDGNISNWIPIDTLMTALAFRAVRVAREQSSHRRVEAFEGSLRGGVDMKATLRSATRGENRLYVRTEPPRITNVTAKSEDVEGFPFVWIFRLAPQKEVDYKLSSDNLRNFREYVEPGGDLDFNRHRHMIGSVIAVTGDQLAPELSLPDYEVIHNERVGQLSFEPDCSVRKAAEWAVKTKLECNPVLSSTSPRDLYEFYRNKFQIDLSSSPWHVALVRMAIPFARKAVTIVTPDGYSLPSLVYDEATRRQVELRVVPLSYFPTESLRIISHIYWLPTVGRNKNDEFNLPIYPPHVLRHFREPVDVYHRLIPKEWQ